MPTAKEIMDWVEAKEDATSALRTRWQNDENLWNLEPFQELDSEDDSFKQYTSNEPRTNAKKSIGMLSGAAVKLTVPVGNDHRDIRDDDNAKERFLRGNFKANDERLIKIGHGKLQQEMAWYLMIRGTTCGRALLRRRPNSGRTFADVTPWDPKDTFWEYGSEGLEWLCHRFTILRTKAERSWKLDNLEKDDNPGQQILFGYDFYDRERNIVVVSGHNDGQVAKEEVHGLVDGDGEPLVPGWVNANMLQPMIAPSFVTSDGGLTTNQLFDPMKYYGESIFADNRHQYYWDQYLTSIRLELAGRSRKPMYGLKSASGVKLIEGDIFKEGAQIPIQADEDLIVYDFLTSAPDIDPLQAKIANEEQKGGFPAVSFGSLPDPISGFAIQNLKGGVADKVMGAAQAEGAALMAIGNIWCDHYMTNAFDTQTLSGQGRNRKWFSATIEPDQLRDLPQAEIELVPELPEDQAGKVQMAVQLATPMADGMPVLSRMQILEDYLQRQDADLDMDSIFAMMGGKNPLVEAQRMTDALANRGDLDGAQAWHITFQMKMIELSRALQSVGTDIQKVMESFNPTTDENRGEDRTNGFSPETLPNAAQGIPSPTPGVDTPAQAGPVVPAGTPRPGAQNGPVEPFF